MKSKILVLLISLLVTSSFGAFYWESKQQNNNKQSNKKVEVASYELAQKEVDKGKYANAVKIYETIQQKAIKASDAENSIKATLLKLKYVSYISEDAMAKALYEIQEITTKTNGLSKLLFHHLLAKSYWGYYQTNRYKFQNRSVTDKINLKDIRTWDLNKIVDQCIYHHTQSVSNVEILKNEKVEKFKELVITEKETIALRPSMYDVLMHAIIDFYSNEEAALVVPFDNFEINNLDFLASDETFVNVSINTNDTTSFDYQLVKYLQQFTNYLNTTTNSAGKIELGIRRLNILNGKIALEDKQSIYLKSLNSILENNSAEPYAQQAAIYLAEYFINNASENKNADYKVKALAIINKSLKTKNLSKINQAQLINLKNTIEHQQLSLQIGELQSEQTPVLAYLDYTNIEILYFTYFKLDKEKYREAENKQKIVDKNYTPVYVDAVNKYIYSSEAIKQWKQNFPSNRNYLPNKIHYKLPELAAGFYAVAIHVNEKIDIAMRDQLSYALIQVSDADMLVNEHNTNITGFLLNRKSGKPIEKKSIKVYSKKNSYIKNYYQDNYDFVKELQTDEKGYFNYQGNENDQIELRCDLNNSTWYNPHVYHLNKSNYGAYQEIVSDYNQSNFYTDRSIYRPGQKIYFKSIVLKKQNKKNELVKDVSLTVSLSDVNGQVIETANVKTNSFGTYAHHFTLPNNVLTGTFTLQDNYGSKTIQVEEYKRPKFEIKPDILQSSYALNDTVAVQGKAMAYNGAALQKAKVKYEVYRETQIPYWWRCFNPWYEIGDRQKIKSGETLTNDTGAYNIKFIAKPDKSITKSALPTFTYKTYITITDINGETHTAEQAVNIGYVAVDLSLNANDFNIKSDKDSNFISISTSNLNGIHVPSEVKLSVYPLQKPQRVFKSNNNSSSPVNQYLYTRDEFYTMFPEEDYGNDKDIVNWKKLEAIEKIVVSTKTLIHEQLLNASVYKTGNYLIEATTQDKNGTVVKEIAYIAVNRENEKPIFISEPFVKASKVSTEFTDYSLYATHPVTALFTKIIATEKDCKTTYEWINFKKGENKLSIPTNTSTTHYSNYYQYLVNNSLYNSNTISINDYRPVIESKTFALSIANVRDKVEPGSKQSYSIKINSNASAPTELLASMYDQSLDALYEHNWSPFYLNQYEPMRIKTSSEKMSGIYSSKAYASININQKYQDIPYVAFSYLNYFEFDFGFNNYNYYNRRTMMRGARGEPEVEMAASVVNEQEMKSMDMAAPKMGKNASALQMVVVTNEETNSKASKSETKTDVAQVRKNFNETVFFYPQLQSDKNEYTIDFTMPDALTKWKFMAIAHNTDLQVNTISKTIQTQKKLMVEPNWPRFVRCDDEFELKAKITNLTNLPIQAACNIALTNPFTNEEISFAKQTTYKINIPAGGSTVVSFPLVITEQIDALQLKITATSSSMGDGEQIVLPVLSNKQFITEALPMPMRSNQTKSFVFEKLATNNSNTLTHYNYALEFTQNPTWLAIKALPSLANNVYECADAIMQQYFTNALGEKIVEKTPAIKQVIDAWELNESALQSPLEKNQELKTALLNETPWVMQAKAETQNTKDLKLFFDKNNLRYKSKELISQLLKYQLPSGSFTWLPCYKYDNPYITQRILSLYAKLMDKNAIPEDDKNTLVQAMNNAVRFLDSHYNKEYALLVKNKIDKKLMYINAEHVDYLYIREVLKNQAPYVKNNEAMYGFYNEQIKKYYLKFGYYTQGQIALYFNLKNEDVLANKLIASIKNNAIVSDELGAYWKLGIMPYHWYEQPIETQAILIRAFSAVTPGDESFIDEMKIWLLKNKQTQAWPNYTSTSDAVYALLFSASADNNATWLATGNSIVVKVGDELLNPETDKTIYTETGTGYFKKSYSGNAISNNLGNIIVTKNTKGISWGAAYWQYFEMLDKITPSKTGLYITKKLFVVRSGAKGEVIIPISEEKVKLGDKVKVRIEIRADRPFNYVHLKDVRATGLEPVDVISAYNSQDNLNYYQSTKDMATHFYFDYMPKGTHVFEYSLFASQSGKFQSGITSIQCLYASEFVSHTQSDVLIIE